MNDLRESHATALVPSGPELANGDWATLPTSPESTASGAPDFTVYLHALRRRWLVSLALGLVFAAAVAAGVYFGVGEKFTATAYLQLALSESRMFGPNDVTMTDPMRFDIFKNTQEGKLRSRKVMTDAMRKPEVAKTSGIREEQQRGGDAVDWLLRQTAVGFPGKAELMQVSITRDNAKEAQTLVNAVVESYLKEVVYVERDRKRQRVDELEKVCTNKDQELRAKRERFRNLAKDTGTLDAELLTTKTKLNLERLSVKTNEQAKMESELARLRGELAGQMALLKNADATDVNAVELQMLINSDQMAAELMREIGYLRMDDDYNKGTARQGVKSSYVGRSADRLKLLEDRYNARVEELRTKIRAKQRAAINERVVQLQTQLASIEVAVREGAQRVAEMRAEAEKVGITTVDIEMLRTEIRHDELLVADMTTEKEKLKVELQSPDRITLVEAADVPVLPSNYTTRLAMTLVAALFGLCCPAVGLAFWDAQAGRINTADDVSKKLRLAVIGSVPRIPSRVIRRLASPSKRSQVWHLRLTESVDGIAARLLLKADAKQCRVIMLSSAGGGEGKTTLATQLALSLARTGRRTVLVDFDLRRPSFDEVFGTPLSPGVSEFLRGQTTVAELVHPTATDNLAVVTAGSWDRQALAALSNGGAAALFERLREDFAFVVVDTSPILPVADARFVSQLVDSVVLSVFRDVSEAPKIQAACEILEAFGVPSIEAVVTGSHDYTYGKHLGHESSSVPA
ncbi:MAG: AAA family ATPase [Thermoguttaceae bacterium]